MTDGARASFSIKSESLIGHVVFAAVICEVVLVLFDFFFNYANTGGARSIRRLFNITREDSLSSWFAMSQTLLVSLTLWAIWLLVRHGGGPGWSRRGWLLVALFFSYMTIDDGAKVHERLGTTLGDALDDAELVDAFPSYHWQLFIMPIFAVAGVALLLFLWKELTERRDRIVLLAALSCLGVALGLDFIEGLDQNHAWNLHAQLDRWLGLDPLTEAWFRRTGYDAVVHFSKSIEEFLEMLANTLFWSLFLRRAMLLAGDLRLRFQR